MSKESSSAFGCFMMFVVAAFALFICICRLVDGPGHPQATTKPAETQIVEKP